MHAQIPVAEIMVADVVTATPEATAKDAATHMRDERVSSVVVVEDERPVGILTEGDFVTCLCDRPNLGAVPLADVMSAPVETVAPDASIVDSVAALRDHEVEHLPVVERDGRAEPTDADGGDREAPSTDADGGELVGIVTTTELAYFVPHLLHRQAESVAERPPRRQVRTDTAYARDDWTFEYRGADESAVSVGDVATFSKPITADDVEAFADATGDTNRLHLEDEYARGTRFGERIVHGVLANGLISAALARLPGLTIYLSQEATFLAPISVGDRVTATCEIVDDLGDAKFRVVTTVEDGDGEHVLEGESVVLVDPLPAAATGEGEATA